MTDRVDSQEAEDVALAIEQISLSCFAERIDGLDEELLAAILARLVREGQIREMEALVAMKGGVPWTYIHARIAALKGEG